MAPGLTLWGECGPSAVDADLRSVPPDRPAVTERSRRKSGKMNTSSAYARIPI